MKRPPKSLPSRPYTNSWRPVAVIDIGSTAIRMTIAQANTDGSFRILEDLQQAVSLGRDTFTRGRIEKSTIEECVRALKSFCRVLEEYQIQIAGDEGVRAVGTTAVCEAENQGDFVDRIYIATGIKVEPIEEMDITRLTFLSLRSLLAAHPSLTKGNLVIAEIGGGSTEVLLVRRGSVTYSQAYRLGSLRLREMLEGFRSAVVLKRDLMENQIHGTIEHIRKASDVRGTMVLLAVGGDARFAAREMGHPADHDQPAVLPVKALTKLTEKLLRLSVNDIVREYHLSFPEAETLGPGLLFYVRLANALGINALRVADVSMRHGLIIEMAHGGQRWDEEYRSLIVRSAQEICRRYSGDLAHAQHVAQLSRSIFQAIADEHRMGPRHEVLLAVSALLHDIGAFISPRNHHKHSMYLIQNSSIFGLNRRDQTIVSLVARYHRRASPRPTHVEYRALDREGRITVLKLAAILRVADALDRSLSQRVQGLECAHDEDRMVITVPHLRDLALEQLAVQNKGPMFEEVYGMKVVLRTGNPSTE